jgi:hypothetical protein
MKDPGNKVIVIHINIDGIPVFIFLLVVAGFIFCFPNREPPRKLKKLIRSPKKPLAQIVKRISGLHFNIPQRRLILGFQH